MPGTPYRRQVYERTVLPLGRVPRAQQWRLAILSYTFSAIDEGLYAYGRKHRMEQ